MPDESKLLSKAKSIIETLKDKMYERFSGKHIIEINWNQGGITEIREKVERKLT